MEETGILENSTLHGLVLPHFEPGRISFCIFARSPFSVSISGTERGVRNGKRCQEPFPHRPVVQKGVKKGVRNRFRTGPWFKKVSKTVAGPARRVLRTTAKDPSLNHDRIAERGAFCPMVKDRLRHLAAPRSTGDRNALRKHKGGLSFRRIEMLSGREKSDNP
jgi:hypothetical protein